MATNDYSNFKKTLKQRESSGNSKAVNDLGYSGGYQFGTNALVDTGYMKKMPKGYKGGQSSWMKNPKAWTGKDGIKSQKDFLNNPDTQEKAMDDYINVQKRYLKSKGAWDYVGKTVDGVPITEEALLAAAHLKGAGGVAQALRKGDLSGSDAYGTTMREYAEMFSKPKRQQESIEIANMNVPQLPFMSSAMANTIPQSTAMPPTPADKKSPGKPATKEAQMARLKELQKQGVTYQQLVEAGNRMGLNMNANFLKELEEGLDPTYEERTITKEQAEQKYGVNPPVKSEEEALNEFLASQPMREKPDRTPQERTARTWPEQKQAANSEKAIAEEAEEDFKQVETQKLIAPEKSPFGTEKIGPSPSSIPNPFTGALSEPIEADREANANKGYVWPSFSQEASKMAPGDATKVNQAPSQKKGWFQWPGKEDYTTDPRTEFSNKVQMYGGAGGINDLLTGAAFADEIAQAEQVQEALSKVHKDQQGQVLGFWRSNDAKTMGLTTSQKLEVLKKQENLLDPMQYKMIEDNILAGDLSPGIPTPVKNPELDDVKKKVAPPVDTTGVPGTKTKEEDDRDRINQGSNALLQNTMPTHWYESEDFSDALITFGLNILDGKGYSTSFKEATDVYKTGTERRKRAGMVDELRQAGYTMPSIMEWEKTGKAAVLQKPETPSSFSSPFALGDSIVQMDTKNKKLQSVSKIPEGFAFQNGVLVDTSPEANFVSPFTNEGDIVIEQTQQTPQGVQPAAPGQAPVGTGTVLSPTVQRYSIPMGGKEGEKKASSAGRMAIVGAKHMQKALADADKEYEGVWADTAFKTRFKKAVGGAEDWLDTAIEQDFRDDFPATSRLINAIQQTIQPMLRYKSGATIKDSEAVREAMVNAAMPGQSKEERESNQRYLMNEILNTISSSTDSDPLALMARDIVEQQRRGYITDIQLVDNGFAIKVGDNWFNAEKLYSLSNG